MAMRWSASGQGADSAGAGKGQGPKKPSRSLVISPNLDALLEYDEQQARGGVMEVEVPFSGPGLPPPPRRSRRVRSPRSPGSPMSPWGASSGPSSPWPASVSTPNPYINPAPVAVRTLESVPEGVGEGEGECGPADGGEVDQRLQLDGGGRGRGPVKGREGVFGVDMSNSPERGSTGRGVKIVAPPHVKRRLQPLKKMEDIIRQPTRPLGSIAIGMDREDGDRILDRSSAAPPSNTLQTRPLLSHGSWRRRGSSSSSSSSSSSGSSESSLGPASTIEARISISSTIYPASSAHSHSHHMYDHNDQDYERSPVVVVGPRRTSSLAEQSWASSLSSFAADRTSFSSFIDINSSPPPDQTLFPSPIIPVTIPDSLLHMSPQSHSQPVTRNPSPKPPIPTAPKPQFPRKRHPSPPPTTNFLQLDERSDLIRKNRKLVRVFGQNPGPQEELPRRHHTVSDPLDLAVAVPASGRRHSAPLTPDDLRFKTPAELYALNHVKSIPSSPTSFIDLSDDPSLATPKKPTHHRPGSPSNQSLFENMSPEEQEEEERRRKREKLVKLHRFLGSRVPINLVLGLQDPEANLPPALDVSTEREERRAWLRRRRSSSAAAFSSTWSDEVDRVKEDLNDKEKAINVRRAQKMEKVFGVAPPQTLYHTRRSPSPSPPKTKLAQRAVSPPSNPNRSSYTKSPKQRRPGTSESAKQLLPKRSPSPMRRRTSIVYSHYQHSLNSLNDILDRDDRASLAELHQYLASGEMSPAPPIPTPLSPALQDFARTPRERRLSAASSLKSERRRSLPARTSVASLASLASEFTITTPRPEVTDFQARRRRAAKLTQFFGVDYRELISDVLESIESGLEHERRRGTLRAEEVEDLLARLRGLRTKRGGLF